MGMQKGFNWLHVPGEVNLAWAQAVSKGGFDI